MMTAARGKISAYPRHKANKHHFVGAYCCFGPAFLQERVASQCWTVVLCRSFDNLSARDRHIIVSYRRKEVRRVPSQTSVRQTASCLSLHLPRVRSPC